MTDPITPDVFAHLVRLAALELDPQEGEYLRGQLNHQLNAIRELEAIPLDPDVTAASHGIPYTPEATPAPRGDDWQPFPYPKEILAQAPQTEDGYIVVPDIPHTELD